MSNAFYAYDRISEHRFGERFGLDFEEFAAGQRFVHRPGITLSQQDNVDESLDTVNAAMLHYDAAYAASTAFKHPLMVSTITVQRLFGLGWKTFCRRIRLTGIESIAMKRPLYGGDTLYAESEILAAEMHNEDTGTLRVALRGVKPDGEQVAEIVYRCEVWRAGRGPRPTAGAAARAREPRFASHRLRDDGALIEQTGIFFEDFEPGESFVHHPGRTVLREEAITHALRSFEWNPLYHQAGAAAGEPAVAQPWVVTIATTLTTRTFGRVAANLAWKDLVFGAEVRAGDTIFSESTIRARRESKSRPDEGILTVTTRSVNQRAEEVLRFERTLLVYRRDGKHPYAAANY